MPILKEGGPDDMMFQQDRTPPHFNKEVMELLSFQRSELTGMELSLDHHICLDLLPLIFPSGGKSRMLYRCYHWLLLCWTFMGG
jgi:hypothetical protein